MYVYVGVDVDVCVCVCSIFSTLERVFVLAAIARIRCLSSPMTTGREWTPVDPNPRESWLLGHSQP